SIPKGEYGPEDDPEREAEREFTEELGLAVPPGPRVDLGTVTQSSGKQVRAWAIAVEDFSLDGFASNEFEMEWPPKSGRRQSYPEVDRAEWMSDAQARKRLIPAQVEFLDRIPGASIRP
ncbi:MAG TPA: NUDIX domain-containing protein, partial [Acidimicrobiales bacterium]|nr:NUDIX domain-containing protein [Acidimicrobiales bacterium]